MTIHQIRKPAPLATEFQPKFTPAGLDAMRDRLAQKTADVLRERQARAISMPADRPKPLKAALFDGD